MYCNSIYKSSSESTAQQFSLMRWYCCWDVGISLRCSLKFSLQIQFFFMCNSREKRELRNEDVAHVTVVSKRSEVQSDFCGFKGITREIELPPGRMRTTWRRCYDLFSFPHARQTCTCEFHSGYAL